MRKVKVEWRRLEVDGATCERCGYTGSEVRQAVELLNNECVAKGVWFELVETPLGHTEIDESNAILIDGHRLEEILPDARTGSSECSSCSDLVSTAGTVCRTVDVGDARYEAVPVALIREAACQVAECCRASCGCG